MQFNCGQSSYEKYMARMGELKNWHPFFALLPRRAGHTCHWLEYIERKGTRVRGWNKFDQRIDRWSWEYRAANAG